MSSKTKSCLIVSFGPVPTPQYQKIEGGGMRCWGLALGLHSKGYDVTVAVNGDFALDIGNSHGISLVNWREDDQFKNLLNTFDVVVMNYAMGGPMSFVVDAIADDVVLVLDCYVPIYIEVSARESKDIVTEYSNYSHDLLHYNKALKRGDYFLCANVPQKHMYVGALGALGIINPYSYKKERILLVPFGVESSLNIENEHDPYENLGIKDKDFTLLWFGGLYPWFNITPLLNTVARLSQDPRFKFVIVGGKNPYNSHPDFVKQYQTTYEFFDGKSLIGKSVFFVDWVDYADRINWYQNANIVISINNVGEENIYSWRTRVMDYVWGEIPMITNGGDPLSDALINAGAAYQLSDTSEESLFSSLSSMIKDPSAIVTLKQRLIEQKSLYHWEKVVEPLDRGLRSDEKPFLDEKLFTAEFKPDTVDQIQRGGTARKIRKIARIPRKLVHIARTKGVRRSAHVAVTTVTNRLKKKARSSERRYFFFSHPIDYTGAPLVLLDILHDFTKNVNPKSINLVYPGGEKALAVRVHKLGIIVDKMVLGIGSRVIGAQLGVRKDDFVLINTVAVYHNYIGYVLGLLESGRLNQATWFIHEDKPEIRFEDKALAVRVKRLIISGRIVVVVPSKQTSIDYNMFFGTDTVKPVTLRVDVPKRYEAERLASDYSVLKFVISGTPSDGRKGQLLAIAAFAKFMDTYQKADPDRYRNFELHLISIEKDYISQQIKSIGDGLLKGKVSYYPKVTKDKAMEITSACNVTICSSLNETFALFVAEGMLMRHILLRNLSSGHDEQLQESVNGYTIDSDDIDDFADKIRTILDKEAVSDAKLKEMGDASFAIAQTFSKSNYYDQLD